jgi:hypothetical protein
VTHGVRQITCKRVSRTTGGLRPPLLVARTDAVADGRFSPTRVAMVPRNSGSSPGSEAGFVRFSPIRTIFFPRGAYAPRSWLHVPTPLQMGDFRRGERYGGVAAASALVHWVEDGQFSPDQSDAFRAAGLRPRSECTMRGRCKGNVSGAPSPFTPAVNISSMRLGNAFRQRRMLI